MYNIYLKCLYKKLLQNIDLTLYYFTTMLILRKTDAYLKTTLADLGGGVLGARPTSKGPDSFVSI